MHRLTILLLITCLLVVAGAAVETTSFQGTPIDPSGGTVCIEVVCPDPGDGDPSVCPERCNGSCSIVTNACCPDSQIAVCSGEASGAPSSVPSGSSTPTSAASSAESSPAASSSQSSAASSASSPPAESSGASDVPEDSSSNTLGLHYYVFPLALILVTKLLL